MREFHARGVKFTHARIKGGVRVYGSNHATFLRLDSPGGSTGRGAMAASPGQMAPPSLASLLLASAELLQFLATVANHRPLRGIEEARRLQEEGLLGMGEPFDPATRPSRLSRLTHLANPIEGKWHGWIR